MSNDEFLGGMIMGIILGAIMSSIIWSCVDNSRVTNIQRRAIELGYATYVDGEFTWEAEVDE